MQKSVAILAVFCALVFAARVEAFSVFLGGIVISTTKEYGGIPEVYMACDVGTANLLIRSLANVNYVNVPYVADPFIYIDADLRPHEKHTCVIYESDSFSFDFDREDNKDDIYGYFTVSRNDFKYDRIITKTLSGQFAVVLGCELC